jgi:hypothetical protein
MQNKMNEPEIKGQKTFKKKLTIFKIPNSNLTEYWDASRTDYIPPEIIGEFSRFSTLLEFGEWFPNPNPNSMTKPSLSHPHPHKCSFSAVISY